MSCELNTEVTYSEFSSYLTKGILSSYSTGFIRKVKKTPQKEIEKALKIKEAYYADK